MTRAYQLKFLLLISVLVFFFSPQVFAETKKLEEKLTDSSSAISMWFSEIAEDIDLYLTGKKVSSIKNDTMVQLENTTYSRESTDPSNVTSLIISPRFPNLEKYWNLKFTTYDEAEEKRNKERGLIQNQRQNNYGATVGLFKMFGKIKTSFQPRIELKNPLQISHSLSFENISEIEVFLINPKLEFFASSSKGTGIFMGLNLNTILSNEFSLTYINEAEYLDRLHQLSVTNGVSFGQDFSDNDAMAYGFFIFANNRDTYHMTGYSLTVSWYHIIYKNVLDLKLGPRIDFMEPEDFKATPAATFQITYTF